MRFLTASLLILAAAIALPACGDKKSGDTAAAKPEVKWPAAPENGAPVAIEFVAMEGEGERRKATFTVFNFADVPVTRFVAELEYRDASGKVLKTFPHTQIEFFDKKSTGDMTAGFFMPPETTKVTAVVRLVQLGGGKPEWKAAPAPAAAPDAP